MQGGDAPGEVQPQAGAAGAVVDAQGIIGLLDQHGLGVANTVVTNRQHHPARRLPGAHQQVLLRIADRVGDDIGDHRAEQVLVEEAQQAELRHVAAGLDMAALQHLLMARQLRLDKVLQLVVRRTQRQLVDPQLVQPQQLHQHAVEAGKLVLDDAVLAVVQQRLGQLAKPLAVGLGEQGQGVLHVMYGGGDHRGKLQPLGWRTHGPKALLCSC